MTRRLAGLASPDVGLTLDEAKALLAEPQRRVVQSQIDETVMATRVCSDCLSVRPIRDRRIRVLQTLFGTVRVAAPRIKPCACVGKGPFDDLPFSPLSESYPTAAPRNCAGSRPNSALATPFVKPPVS